MSFPLGVFALLSALRGVNTVKTNASPLAASTLPRRIAEGHMPRTTSASTGWRCFNVTSANCPGALRRQGGRHLQDRASTLPRRIAEGHDADDPAGVFLVVASTIPRRIAEGHHGDDGELVHRSDASTLPRRIAEGHPRRRQDRRPHGVASTVPRRSAEGHGSSRMP